MIEVKNLSYEFPQKELYTDISFTLLDHTHCAFIGSNGSGKSTLVDILVHPDNYMYKGSLNIPDSYRFGYVSQFVDYDAIGTKTVFEFLSEPFVIIQDKINALFKEMETATNVEPLMETYQEIYDIFLAMDGDHYENNIKKQLNLSALSPYIDFPVKNLSGGEIKLVQVMKEMLTLPQLLILDEPDVFLDFDNLNALKDLINYHKGGLLVITHNRYLLNHCFNQILHLENKQLQQFDGNYLAYNFSLLQGKIELLELAMEDEAEIQRNESIIKRLRIAATNYADPAKGKLLKARVSLVERLKARQIKPPFLAIKEPEIHFPFYEIDSTFHQTQQSKEDTLDSINKEANSNEEAPLLSIKDFSISFEDVLLKDINLEIKKGEKVAIIGPNGTGKTTLLHEIYKNNHKNIQFDSNVKLGFLSQIQKETLNEENTIKQEFYDLGLKTGEEIEAFLADFGFDATVLTQQIASLSGGEKNMLQLAKLSCMKTNFLLLDEPTSHLDLYAQISLEKAIKDYNGCILMVSHDFYSIVNCMDYAYLIDDKSIRKIRMRKFRQMIYKNHFNKDYLLLEDEKKELETKIELAMKASDFELAKELSKKVEPILAKLS